MNAYPAEDCTSSLRIRGRLLMTCGADEGDNVQADSQAYGWKGRGILMVSGVKAKGM